MSESFSTVLVKDDRLNCKDNVKYAVYKGGANVTYSEIKANSETNSSHVYNVIVPSEQTIIDRRVEWSSEIRFKLNFTGLPPATGSGNIPYDLVQYGKASALCAYPLHSCCSTISATINNNTVSQNMDDVLQPMIRFLERKHTQKYTATTPTMPDNYLNYADGVSGINNPLGAFNNAEKESDYQARGSFQLLGINQSDFNDGTPDNTVYTGSGGSATLWVRVRVTEPFMMSPFIFAHEKSNNQGMYGIQNLNFRMNINSQARIWRQAQITNEASTPTNIPIPTITIDSFVDSKLIFCYLTPHPEDLLPAKNVVSFLEMPRYLTSGPTNIPALGTVQVNTQTLQLNQVPDKLIVFARRKVTSLGASDAFLPIKNISINWNNTSGILSTASQEKLWLMSVESGINQTWLEWSGQAKNYNATVSGGVPVGADAYKKTPLVGGILALDFGKDINIHESYYSSGSLGTFQLQIRLGLFNQDPDLAVNASNYEIVVITLNSGVFVCERGTSSTYTAILTKQDVLDASAKPAYHYSDVARVVGGGLMDNLKSSVGSAMAGSGMSGAGMSGAGTSGGAELGGMKRRVR